MTYYPDDYDSERYNEMECPNCGASGDLIDYGTGGDFMLYGIQCNYWSCYECGHDFGGDLDDNGKVKDDRENEP